MMTTIRVLFADDHAVVRRGLEALIGSQPDMEVVGTAVDGTEAISLAAKLQPDVTLLDLQMPHRSGLDALAAIRADDPQARVLILTSFGSNDTIFAAIKAGAMGYLLKDSSPEELLSAIRNVYNGRPSLPPDIALKVIQEINKPSPNLPPTPDPLTEREVEILRLVARGLSNQAIADEFVVSERTVRTHLSNILAKLHLANRTQAALYALRQGIAKLDEE